MRLRQLQLLVIVFIGGVIMIVGYLLSVQIMIYRRLNADCSSLSAQRKTLEQSKAQLIGIKSSVQSLDLDLKTLTKTLDLQDIPSFTHKVELLAVRKSLSITGWRTVSTQHHPLYNDIELELSAKGTYTAFVFFLKELLRVRQVSYVDDVSIERNLTGPGWSLRVTLKVYQPQHVVADNSSDSTSTNSVDFLGLLQQGQRVWGVICLPDGQITHVKTGDHVSGVSGNVTRINAHAIWFSKQHFVLHSAHSGCRIPPAESRA